MLPQGSREALQPWASRRNRLAVGKRLGRLLLRLSHFVIEDLSTKHQPLSNLFAHPQTRDQWDAYQLSKEQIEFYDRNGYVAGIPMLADDQVEHLRRELNELVDGPHPARHLFYEYNSNESTD